jgi:hypothetical protein
MQIMLIVRGDAVTQGAVFQGYLTMRRVDGILVRTRESNELLWATQPPLAVVGAHELPSLGHRCLLAIGQVFVRLGRALYERQTRDGTCVIEYVE